MLTPACWCTSVYNNQRLGLAPQPVSLVATNKTAEVKVKGSFECCFDIGGMHFLPVGDARGESITSLWGILW